MRFGRLICILLCLILVLQPGFTVFGEQTDPSVTSGCHSVDAAAALGGSEKLLDTSKAVAVYERTTGTLVYGYNMDQQIFPASMVKMMTALVAMKYGELTDTVVVTRSALNSVAVGSVSAHLVRGEEISLKDLLYLMMVGSANDASAVIAEHIAGSQDAFAVMMNEMAAELGCMGSHFSNAHGLHDEDTYTTTRDILRIIEFGLQNEVFRQMFETVEYTVPATNLSEERNVVTTNYLMTKSNPSKYYDSRVTGGKTGATNQAGRCLAVTANVGNMELVAIVMGAKPTYSEDGLVVEVFGSFEEMKALLDHIQKTYECRQLFYPDQIIHQYPVNGGSNLAVTPADSVSSVLPKEVKAEELSWRFDTSVGQLQIPVQKGQPITEISVWYQGLCLAQTKLQALHAVGTEPDYLEPDEAVLEEKNHGRLLATIFGVLLGIVVVALLGLLAVRFIRIAIIKAKLRRRRKNRRRNRNARMG